MCRFCQHLNIYNENPKYVRFSFVKTKDNSSICIFFANRRVMIALLFALYDSDGLP